jgi:hypothetical protein
MKRYAIFIAILGVAMVTLACGIHIDLPITKVETGPTRVDDIFVENLAEPSDVARLFISIGAGKLSISPGEEGGLVRGTVTYNVADFKPQVSIDGDEIRLEQGDLDLEGIPSFRNGIENEWDLKLGTAPMELTINAGAYKGEYDLGGLALESLQLSDGASEVDLSFSEPNLVEMGTFRYNTGASNVVMKGLANTNADTIILHGGAGDYTLDFSGELKRDLAVSIEVAFSSLDIVVPEGVPARVSFTGGLSDVNARGEWEKDGGDYIQPGSGQSIKITITMAAGSLDLSNQ